MCLLLFLLPAGVRADERGLIVKSVRYSAYAAFTRIVFEVENAAPYVLTRSPDGRSIMLSSYEGPFVLKTPLPAVRSGVVVGIETLEEAGRIYALIRLDANAGPVKDFTLRAPDRIVLDIANNGTTVPAVQATDRPIVVVLDPGHGGKDAGLLTGQGIEKNINLELALAVKKMLLLYKPARIRVVLTRDRDQSLSLDERAALANAVGGSVFVSIHSAQADEGRVYIQDIVDEPASSAVQNHPANGDFLGYETEHEQLHMIWGKQQTAHAEQSGDLGRKIERLLTGNDSKEPVQAPLAGLKAVDAAAVMVEVGSLQNRGHAADAIAGGIEQYVVDKR